MPREEKMDKEVADNLCLCDFCKSHLAPAASVAQPFPSFEELLYSSCFLELPKCAWIGNNCGGVSVLVLRCRLRSCSVGTQISL